MISKNQCCGAGGDLEPEPAEIWSRSRNNLINKYFMQSVGRMLLDEEKLISTSIETYFLWYYCYRKVLSDNIWLEPEPKYGTKVEPEINHFGSATLE